MPITLVHSATEVVVTNNTVGSITINGVAAGNLLTCSVSSDSEATANETFSFSDGVNTWSVAVTKSDLGNVGAVCAIAFAASVASGNTTLTVTCSHAETFYIQFEEWSGFGASPLNGTDTNLETGNITAHVSGATGLATSESDLILCVGALSDTKGTGTPGTGYTQLPTASIYNFFQYQIFSGGVSGEKGAWTSANGRHEIGCMAAFKAAAGGPPPGSSPGMDGGMGGRMNGGFCN